MDLNDAMQLLRAFGLFAWSEPGPTLIAVADSSSGADGRGVDHQFSLSIQRTTAGWLLRLNSSADGEEFPNLEGAVLRVERAFHDYRELQSPRVYGDQFARFESAEPLPAIEAALMNEGWIERNEALVEMGLTFVGGANFRIPFDRERRIVVVVVSPPRNDDWQLTVKCYRQSVGRVPIRGQEPDGTPHPDDLAPELSHRVAAVLHPALAQVASNIKWSVHHDPTCGPYSTEPQPPEPGGAV